MDAATRLGITCITLLLSSGCSPYFHQEMATLPDGSVGQVRVATDEVLTEDTPILCRWWRNQDMCATPQYWRDEAERVRRKRQVYRRRATNFAGPAISQPSPADVGQ